MRVLVAGASGGIGLSLVEALAARDSVEQIIATWHSQAPGQQSRTIDSGSERVQWRQLDLTDEAGVAGLAKALANEMDSLDWVINCAGFLHRGERGPEKTVARLEADFFMDSMRLNALPSLLLARHLRRLLKASPQAVFAAISARVGSIEENHLGGWYSYRASKAALNMALKTLALEWRVAMPKCCVAALHPGTTDTELSRPFQGNVPEHKLFSPQRTAAQLLTIVDGLTPAQTGRFWSWDGSELPW